MRRAWSILLVCALVPACGGGGGSSPPPGPRARLLFTAEKNAVGVDELFSLDDAGVVHALSGPLVPNGNVFMARGSWDGRWVAFLADKELDETWELYVVPATGGAAVKVSGPLVSGGDVDSYYVWSGDSSRVLFRADAVVDEQYDLFVATPEGGPPTRVTDPMAPGGDVFAFRYGWAGTRVIYSADQEVDGVGGVYSWPLPGGPALNLTHALSMTGSGSNMTPSWDETRVAIIGRADPASPPQFFSVPAGGGGALTLSSPAATSFGSYISGSFDSSAWAFVENNHLYTVKSDGSARTKVSVHTPVVFGSLGWTADSQFVIYRSTGGGTTRTYSAAVGVPDSEVEESAGIATGPVGHQLIYSIDGAGRSLWVKPAGVAGSGTKISGSPAWTVDVGAFVWSPDGRRVAYSADEDADGFIELYTVLPDGTGRVKVSGTLAQGGIEGITWDRDSSRIYFVARGDDPAGLELYSTDPLGIRRERASGPLAPGGTFQLITFVY